MNASFKETANGEITFSFSRDFWKMSSQLSNPKKSLVLRKPKVAYGTDKLYVFVWNQEACQEFVRLVFTPEFIAKSPAIKKRIADGFSYTIFGTNSDWVEQMDKNKQINLACFRVYDAEPSQYQDFKICKNSTVVSQTADIVDFLTALVEFNKAFISYYDNEQRASIISSCLKFL